MVSGRGPRLRLEEAVVEDVDSDEGEAGDRQCRLVPPHPDDSKGATSRAPRPGRRRSGQGPFVHSYCSASRMFSREARRAGRIPAYIPATIVATPQMKRAVPGVGRTLPMSAT